MGLFPRLLMNLPSTCAPSQGILGLVCLTHSTLSPAMLLQHMHDILLPVKV